MATRRFVLYVDSEDQKQVLAPWMRAQTHVQLMKHLQLVPSWLDSMPRPVLVDLLNQEACWGTEIAIVMNSKKPPSKFAPVEDLD